MLENARRFRNIGECSVAIVVVEDVLSALAIREDRRRPSALVDTRPRLGHRSGRQVEIDIVGHEQIEAAVAIVIDESAACVPAFAVSGHAGLFADVSKSAVAIIVIENAFAEVSDEEIVPAIVVVVADANALAPAGMGHAGFRDVGKGAIAVVPE